MDNQDQSTDVTPRRVRLLQCGRRSCSYVLTEDERAWRRDPGCSLGRRTAVCPACGADSFYNLNAQGKALTAQEMRSGDTSVDPSTIDPTGRMGPKKRAQLLAVRRRALTPPGYVAPPTLAEKIASALLTPHRGEEGTRLAIKKACEDGSEKDLGGNCKKSIVRVIEKILEEHKVEAEENGDV